MGETASETAPDRSTWVGIGFIGSFAVVVFALVAPQWIGTASAQDLRLFVPYTAMAATYFLLAIWCLLAIDRCIRDLIGGPATGQGFLDPHVRWAACALGWLVLWLVLQQPKIGLGGTPGRIAIENVGTAFTGGAQAMRYITGAANALALMVVVLLMYAAYAVVKQLAHLSSDAPKTLPTLIACQRTVGELLQAGAAFAFVSTTTLFLFFALAEEVRTRPEAAKSTPPHECAFQLQAAGAATWTVDCQSPASVSRSQSRGAEAASIAFGVGVTFAGVLFIALFSAGRAVDRAVARAESTARSAPPSGATFHAAEWRRSHGLPESGLAQSVVQAVLLFAPTAAAGLAVLMKS